METTLRDGTSTADRRLDRLVQFDERNRQYPVMATVDRSTPRSYTWSVHHWLDQGTEGRCVEFSICHEMLARPKMVERAKVDGILAERGIYWPAQQRDPWPGGSYPGASPQYEGTSVLAGMQVATELGYYSEYRWAFNANELAVAVSYKGPAVLGINWYEGMFDTDSKGFLHATGSVAGGHAIMCNGYNVPGRYFKLHNSWGPDWGVNGKAYISFEDMERLLAEQGDACIPVVRNY